MPKSTPMGLLSMVASPECGFKRLRRQEAFGALGVVVDDVGAESDFTAALGDQLTHLQGDETRKLVRARAQD